MEERKKSTGRTDPTTSHSSRLRDGTAFLAGLGAGALITYLLDPQQGARRRALVGDKSAHFARSSGRRSLRALRHTRNQVEGFVASASALFTPVGPASDRKLLERIRARLGHTAEHLSKLELEVHRGDVLIRGQVPEGEISTIVRAIRATRGVRTLTDNIERPNTGMPIQ